jgi:type IV pilus assembly protein PilB
MLIDFLKQSGVITLEQYDQLKKTLTSDFGGDLEKALLSLGVTEEAFARARSQYYGIPFQKVDPSTVTEKVLTYVNEEAAQHYQFVPFYFADGVLSVGVINPENPEAINALQFVSTKLGIPFKVFLIETSVFKTILEQYKSTSTADVDVVVGELNAELQSSIEEITPKKEKETSKEEQNRIVEDAPTIKIVAVIINHAVEGNASDIHIENTGEKIRVRYRVDGDLHTTLELPRASADGIVARIKILAKLRLDEKRKPQDGSFATLIDGRKIEFRVSTFPAYYGEKVVMRILDSERGVRTLSEIQMTDKHREEIKGAIAKPFGLVLISGPTGSGKSTTLYSMLKEVDKDKGNVVSLEDPVEYQVAGITQSQVLPEIGYTFASGLRSILRQDPDIIMVGEIRDKETAQLAIQAALTGHLVFSTIHTNSAIGVIPRLVDMGVDPYLIAPTLALAVAQRLVRGVHPSARTQVPMDESTRALIVNQFKDLPDEYRNALSIPEMMYEIHPTSESPTGLKGRVPIFEMFTVDKDLQEVILKNPNEPEIYRVCRAKGMITLKEDALIKALNGEVQIQEAFGF